MKSKLETFTPRILCVCTNCLAELVRIDDTAHLLKCKFDKYQQKCLFTRLLVSVKPVDCKLKKRNSNGSATCNDILPSVHWISCKNLRDLFQEVLYVPIVSIHFHLLEAHRTRPSKLLIGFNRLPSRMLGGSHLNSIDFCDVQAGYKMMDHDVFLSTYRERGREK